MDERRLSRDHAAVARPTSGASSVSSCILTRRDDDLPRNARTPKRGARDRGSTRGARPERQDRGAGDARPRAGAPRAGPPRAEGRGAWARKAARPPRVRAAGRRAALAGLAPVTLLRCSSIRCCAGAPAGMRQTISVLGRRCCGPRPKPGTSALPMRCGRSRHPASLRSAHQHRLNCRMPPIWWRRWPPR
jgi:hypothetical protein